MTDNSYHAFIQQTGLYEDPLYQAIEQHRRQQSIDLSRYGRGRLAPSGTGFSGGARFVDRTSERSFYESELSRYKSAGYSPEYATILANWSMKHQQTPTSETASNIIYRAKGFSSEQARELSGQTSGTNIMSKSEAESYFKRTEQARAGERQAISQQTLVGQLGREGIETPEEYFRRISAGEESKVAWIRTLEREQARDRIVREYQAKQPWWKRAGGIVKDVSTSATAGRFFVKSSDISPVVYDKGEGRKKGMEAVRETAEYALGGMLKSVLTPSKAEVGGVIEVQKSLFGLSRKSRHEADVVSAMQEKQIGDIDAFAEKLAVEQDKLPTEKAEAFAHEIEVYEKGLEAYEEQAEVVKEMATALSKKEELTPKQYQKYLKEYEEYLEEYGEAEDIRVALESEYTGLEKRQKGIQQPFLDYEKTVEQDIKNLERTGIKTSKTAEGDITFTSEWLEKEISAPGFLTLKSLQTPEGEPTWKSRAFEIGGYAHSAGEIALISYLTAGIGVTPYISTKLTGLGKFAPKIAGKAIPFGKLAQVGLVGGVGYFTAKGIQSKVKSYEIEAMKLDMPKGVGTRIGLIESGVDILASGAGTYAGTKAYYGRLTQDIVSGKYTKSIAETRRGVLLEAKGEPKGGLAKQLGAYETKIAGTDHKLVSLMKLKGKYHPKSGISDVDIYSEFIGKKPIGVSKAYITKGQLLETRALIKAKLFTQGVGDKAWTRDTFLIGRRVIGKPKLYDPIKDPWMRTAQFQKYVKAEDLKLLASIKRLGVPIKVKTLPKTPWTKGEIIRFLEWKKAGKVVQPWEPVEAVPEMTFATRQVIFYKPKQFLPADKDFLSVTGRATMQEFQSIGRTAGASDKLLTKDLMKLLDTQAKVKLPKATGISWTMDKKGELALTQQIFKQAPPVITKQVTKVPKTDFITQLTKKVETKALLSVQLEKIVPKVVSKELLKPALISTPIIATIPSLKELIGGRIHQTYVTPTAHVPVSMTKLETSLAQITAPAIKQVQLQKITQIQKTALKTPTIHAPTIKMPVVPPSPVITWVPWFPPPPALFGGGARGGYREPTIKQLEGGLYRRGFTAGMLDIKPKLMTKAQYKKLLETRLTGLELRPQIIVSKRKKKKKRRR